MREHHVARHLGADGLRVVVVEHQPVHVARQVFHGAGNTSVGRKVLAPQHVHIHTALIDPLVAGGMSRRYGHWLFDAAIEQRVPARGQMVESRSPVSKIAIGRPAALAEVLRAHHHVHAAVDRPVHLLAQCVAANRRSVADHRRQQSACPARFVGRMVQVGKIKNRHAEKFEERIRGRRFVVGQIDGVRDDPPVGAGKPAVGDGAVDDAIAALACLQQHPARKQQRVRRGIHHRVPHGMHALRPVHVVEACGMHVEPHVAVRGVDEHVIGAAGKL